MKRSPSVMLVTQAFPPEAAPGVHRMLGLCRYLVEHNWRVTVITSHPSKDAAIDEQLMKSIPPEVRVISVPSPSLPLLAARILKPFAAMRQREKNSPHFSESREIADENIKARQGRLRFLVDWLSWWLHIPDSRAGWLLPALGAGLFKVTQNRPDVIFSSAPPWTSLVTAAVLSRLTNIPLVADFRDPWCGSAFHKLPYAAHRRANSLLEAMVVRRASRITCAWDGIRQHLHQRYHTKTAGISTILNGFNQDLINGIEPIFIDSRRRVFLHTGGFYGPRSPEPILAALQYILRTASDLLSNVLVVFLGPTSYNGRPIDLIAQDYGVQDYVRVMPRVSHHRALAFLKGADVALLFGQSGCDALASIPAKAYEYIGLKKTVFAIGAGVEVCEVMRRGGCRVWRLPGGEPQQIASAIIHYLKSDYPSNLLKNYQADTGHDLTQTYMAQQLEGVLLSCFRGRQS